MAIIQGTPGNDTIIDPNSGDVIVGLDGNDFIGSFQDTIIEGNGNDTVIGGNGTVYAGNGNDQFIFSGFDNTLFAGDGNDTVKCTLYGSGNRIVLGFGIDTVIGTVGHDYIYAPGNHATIDGLDGSDTIILGGCYDHVIEREGNASGYPITPDNIWLFRHTDKLMLQYGKHAEWHQTARGMLIVNGYRVADVHGHHLTAHDLIFF